MSNRRRVGVFVSNAHALGRYMAEGVFAFAQAQNWKLAVVQRAEQEMLARLGNELDGIIAGVNGAAFAKSLEAWGKPCVDLYWCMANNSRLPRVCCDHQAIGRAGAQHLLDLGLKHLGFCALRNYTSSQLRQEAFQKATQQAGGLCFVHEVDTNTSDWPSIWKKIAAWVAALPKPIGLMAANDSLALEVLDACKEVGARVPTDVALLGVNNDVQACDRANPPLSSVDLDLDRIGYRAAALLEDMMAGKPVLNSPILFPPKGVVVRASTDMVAIQDPQVAEAQRYIRKHACDPVQVKDILDIVHLSRRALEMRFAKVLGRSPHGEIRRIQLQQAMRLLAQPDLPLEQVARASGLGNAVAMVRVFRQELGMTPGEHRRRFEPLNAAAS